MSRRKAHSARAKAAISAPTLQSAAADTSAQPSTSLFDRYFFAPIPSVRPWLLERVLLLMVAFDTWVNLMSHGGRYGFGDFNVAHFTILDALPSPTPSTYVAVVGIAGVTAAAGALVPSRVFRLVTFATYSYGWSMSMLDSYQHHYLLSWLLLLLIFFPTTTPKITTPRRSQLAAFALCFGALEFVFAFTDAPTLLGAFGDGPTLRDPGVLWLLRALLVFYGLFTLATDDAAATPQAMPKTVVAPAWVMTMVTVAIVYFYTGITKLTGDWAGGAALQRIGHAPWLDSLAANDAASFFRLLSVGAIAIQVASMAAYLASPVLTRRQHRPWFALLVAVPSSFHLLAELGLVLDIGLFSYYILAVAAVSFFPSDWLERAVSFSSSLRFPDGRLAAAVALIAAAVLLSRFTLPGGLAIGIACGLIAALVAYRAKSLRPVTATSLALVTLTLVTAQTHAAFDFYRFQGGEYRRHGQLEEALSAFRMARSTVVRPFCVYSGSELRECYRTEARADEVAERLGFRVQKRDRANEIVELEAELHPR